MKKILMSTMFLLSLSSYGQRTIKYFPNPTSNIVNIVAIETIEEVETVTVFNTLGQIVLTDNSLTASQIDLSKMANGIYIFRVVFDGGSIETFKIIKR